MNEPSPHPSELAQRPPAAAGHPLDAWVKMMGDRLDDALSQVDQAYRDAKWAGSNVDAAERRDRDQHREADPAGLAEPAMAFVHAPDALHRTHIKAMDVYGSLAVAMASSIRDALLTSSIEMESEHIIS